MAIYVNGNADKKTATATLTDIEIKFPQMIDVIEKAEKCLDLSHPEDRKAFQDRVFDTGMRMSADLDMRKMISDHQRQDVSYIIRTYLNDKLESKKYTKMLSPDGLLHVYDLRKVSKLSENERAILEYFRYFDLGMQYRSSCRFVRHLIDDTDVYATYILIDERFNSKYVPLRAALYHEFGHYQQYLNNNTFKNGGDKAHVGKGDRDEHNADWYAVKRLYQEGYIDDIRKMIAGHIKRYVETDLEESLYRANLIKRACRRYGMKI